MKRPNRDDRDPHIEPEPPDEYDFEALVAFYERTGVMAVNTLGPPIDRPIIPKRRPDRLGDFCFIPGDAAPIASEEAIGPIDPEAERLQQEFLEMLDARLKRP